VSDGVCCLWIAWEFKKISLQKKTASMEETQKEYVHKAICKYTLGCVEKGVEEYLAEIAIEGMESGNETFDNEEVWRTILTEAFLDAESMFITKLSVNDLVSNVIQYLQENSVIIKLPEIEEEISENEIDNKYDVGLSCLAILAEDDDWHEAEIVSLIDKETIEVIFVEFSKSQVVCKSDIILADDIATDSMEITTGCEMCERNVNLTRHHLIPRDCHAKYLKKGYTRDFLNRCIDICRTCHSKIHHTEDNRTLAQHFSTLDTIMAHESILKYVNYARKQKSRVKPRMKGKKACM